MNQESRRSARIKVGVSHGVHVVEDHALANRWIESRENQESGVGINVEERCWILAD